MNKITKTVFTATFSLAAHLKVVEYNVSMSNLMLTFSINSELEYGNF